MNARERMLAIGVLLVVLIVGGGLLFQVLFLSPLRERNDSIADLLKEIQKKEERVQQIESDLPKLERWQRLSLPADDTKSKRLYGDHLSDMMRDSGFAAGTYSVTPPKQVDTKSAPSINKEPIYKKLDFNVKVNTSLANLVTFLEQFYQTGLLHQIKKLSIQRPLTPGPQQQPTDLDINFTIEALILNKAEQRPTLLPGVSPRLMAVDVITALRGGPTGIALVPWICGPTGPLGPGILARTAKEYAAIAEKNIFFGASPVVRTEDVAVTRFVYLNHITRNDRRAEAWLYNRYDNRWTRLRSEAGFDSFRVTDEKGEKTLVKGRVVRIESREVIFKTDENYYAVHVDQTLDEAMKKPLTSEEQRGLGLVSAANGDGHK